MPPVARAGLIEAAKVVVISVLSFGVMPLWQLFWSGAPEIVSFSVSAVLAGLLMWGLEYMWSAAAWIEVHIKPLSTPEVTQQQLVVRISDRGRSEDLYVIDIVMGASAWFSARVLKKVVAEGLRLRIEAPHTSLTMTVEHSPSDPAGEKVRVGNGCCIEFDLTGPVPTAGHQWAGPQVAFEGLTSRPLASWDLMHSLVFAGGRRPRYDRLIKVDAKVASIVEVWS